MALLQDLLALLFALALLSGGVLVKTGRASGSDKLPKWSGEAIIAVGCIFTTIALATIGLESKPPPKTPAPSQQVAEPAPKPTTPAVEEKAPPRWEDPEVIKRATDLVTALNREELKPLIKGAIWDSSEFKWLLVIVDVSAWSHSTKAERAELALTIANAMNSFQTGSGLLPGLVFFESVAGQRLATAGFGQYNEGR